MSRILLLPALLLLAACTHLDTVKPPEIRRSFPGVAPAPAPGNGAIFQVGMRGLLDDRRAREVGDQLTIIISESTSSSKRSKSTASRSSGQQFGVEALMGVPGRGLVGQTVEAANDTSFDGRGESENRNTLQGTVAVTVVEVLPNGNLVVSGEKQVVVNRNTEVIRLTGVVRPDTVTPENTVSSSLVADARIEYAGRGYLTEAQQMGWMQRIFLSLLPF